MAIEEKPCTRINKVFIRSCGALMNNWIKFIENYFQVTTLNFCTAWCKSMFIYRNVQCILATVRR